MAERKVLVTIRQAETMTHKVAACNTAFDEMVKYFAAICDSHDLPASTEFVSVNTAPSELVVRVPDDD